MMGEYVRKTSGLAIASLVLGILGMFCCGLGIFTGIAAVICGHMARGVIKREPLHYGGAGMALAGLILGYISIATTVGFVTVAIVSPDRTGMETGLGYQMTQAQKLQTAIQKMAMDGKATGNKNLGYPADAGITTVRELEGRLIKGHYLDLMDIVTLHFGDFDIGNVSDSDPPDTILVKIRQASSNFDQGIICRKGGDKVIGGTMLEKDALPPPRNPAYLPP